MAQPSKKSSNGRNADRKIQRKLRGERPPGVVGRMKPRQLIEALDRAQREADPEQEERSWRELERILREDPV